MTADLVCGARRDIACGLGLALAITVFVDAAILTVPLYDMQLYDRVLQSRNMDTLLLLSLVCAVGLLLYGLLDALRAGVFAVVADCVARRIQVPLLRIGVAREVGAAAGAKGAETVRALNELHAFLSSGAPATLMDALCSPLLIGLLFLLHPAFGFLCCTGVALLVALNLLTDRLVRPALTAASAEQSRVAARLAGRLRDPELLDGLGMLPALAQRWSAEQAAAMGQAERVDRRARSLAAVSRLLRLLLAAAVMVVGALLILAHQTTPGALMGANLLLNKSLGPFDHLIGGWRSWSAAQASWRRVSTALAEAPGPAAQDAGDDTGEDGHGLVVQSVGLRAPGGRPLLADVGFDVPPGRVLAVVGPNGAGKSTLLRLLAGVLPPGEGRIRLGGRPIAGADIGYLPQGVAMLDGSIAENIARFTETGMEATVAAAAQAGVHMLIGRLRRGYETRVDAAGGVSGGQAQRLGLARALFATPRLLVLDEPDANLDHDGDTALLAAIGAARDSGAIVVVTTHRPRLLAAADLVLSLRGGRVETLRENISSSRSAAKVAV